MKEILKRKIPVFLIVLVIITITFFVAYYFLPETLLPRLGNIGIKNPNESPDTVFKQVDLKRYESNLAELQKVLGTGDYWDNWTWEEKMIESEIVEVDKENNTLLLYPARPKDQKFSKTFMRAYVKCEEDNTVAVSAKNPTISLNNGGFKLLEEAVKGDVLYTYCLDEGCLNVGKQCILMKTSD